MSLYSSLEKDLNSLADDLAQGSITSEEITNQCFDEIDRNNAKLGALLSVDKKTALVSARESDARRQKGQSLGVLDGIPIVLKDMILMKGLPCTAASKILQGFMPPYEATVVNKLRQNGAVLVGKANQDEFAMGSSNEASAYQACRNPWDLERTPGGSSGGSAVSVSARMCMGSLGTDTGGSIRQPAAYCGIVGIKPSYGRVSRFGIIAFASSLDQVGPFAKTVKDAAIILKAIAGFDPNDATSVDVPVPDYANLLRKDVKGKKIGIPKEYFSSGVNDDVRQAIERAMDILRAHGAEMVDITLPHTKYAVATYYIIATAEASSNLGRYDGIRFGPRQHDGHDLTSLYERTRGDLFGPEVKRRIMLGTYVLSAGYYDAYYLRAQKVRRLFSLDFDQAFKSVDAILSPTTPTTAFKLGEKLSDPLAMYLNDVYTISANLAGICGISIPVGKDKAGMPIGMQLMAKAFGEQNLFDIASVVEEEQGYLGLSSP